MTDPRDLPIEIARRAAGLDRDAAEPREGFRLRERLSALVPPMAWVWRIAGVAALVVLVGVSWQPVTGWLRQELRTLALDRQADTALAQGRLTAADGSGARELYEAALAIDPDSSQARQGLREVADAALAQARAALAQNRAADAGRHLVLARALSASKAEVDAVASAMERRESTRAEVDALMARATAAHRAGRLDGGDAAALPLYRRVLELQPEHAEALRGRDAVLAARRAAAVETAMAREPPGPGDAEPAGSATRKAADTETLRRAEADLRRGRLQQAAEGYRAVLAGSADAAAATEGLARVADGHAARARRLAADFEFAEAEVELATARALAPDAAAVRDAARDLERARAARARVPQVMDTERRRRVRGLLDQAAAALARGDLMDPPGESAFDKIAAARALAPDAVEVRSAALRLESARRAQGE